MYYIANMREDDRVIDHYFCKQKQSLKTNSGKTYLSLKLQDKTGLIDAKVWELTNDIQAFEEGDVVKVDGSVLLYQNALQMKVLKLRRSREGEYSPADLNPSTDKDIDSLYAALKEKITGLKQPLRQLCEDIYNSDLVNGSIRTHSAAKAMHHGYMGGLLEHTVSVTEICEFMAGRYKYVQRDVLVAAALLHDIGKIQELSPFPQNDYTDDGELLGHIVIGAQMVHEAAARIPNFPHELESLLTHAILAHHGQMEWGSPKQPKTIEAFLLHCADDTDAKAKMFEDMVANYKGAGKWVGYNRPLERNIRKADDAL